MNASRDEILQAYGLNSEFPDRWTDPAGAGATMEPVGTNETADDGVGKEALVEEFLKTLTASKRVASDEKDPLGTNMTIMQVLQGRNRLPGTALERAKYMPSSTEFDPKLFLRDVHADASLTDLQHSLIYLKKSMAGNDQGLRQVVDTDYESYVSSKRRLDDVMAQLHSLGVSESTEYGLSGLRTQLDQATNKLTVCARPLDDLGSERKRLQAAASSLESQRVLFELPQSLLKCIASNDHEHFMREYKRGVRSISQHSYSQNPDEVRLADVIARRTHKILEQYRQQLREGLMRTGADDAYALYFSKLVDLGVPGNPALEWIDHNIQRFSSEIDDTFNFLKIISQRNLASALESGKTLDLVTYLRRLPVGQSVDEVASFLDTYEVEDSEDTITQWTSVLSQFESLRKILGRATVFYREFLSLSQTHSGSGWALSPQQRDMVTRRCLELVSMTSARLVQSLTEPLSESAALPVASAHSNSDRNKPDQLSFLPLHSNSLAVAKYLGRILEGLSMMLGQATDLIGTQNDLMQGVAVVKEQFVKTLGDCWARDSMQFGEIQDWAGSVAQNSLPQYFTMYHTLIIERLRFLLDSSRGGPASADAAKKIGDVFPAALSLSIRSIEISLTGSAKMSPGNAEAAAIEAQLQPLSLSQDAKLLVTLNNLGILRAQSLEQVYDAFESVLKQTQLTRAVRAQITPEVDRLAAQLFDIYIRKKRSRLAKVVSEETSRRIPQWREDKEEVKFISSYVYESLMILVEIHALFLESCPQMARRAILELYMNLLGYILGVLREADALSRYGTLQNIADLEFMRAVMKSLPETKTQCQLIFDAIKQASKDESVWQGQGAPRSYVMGVLNSAIQEAKYAFQCFKKLE